MSENSRTPELNEPVFVLEDEVLFQDKRELSITKGTVTRFEGPRIFVTEETSDGYISRRVNHRTNVFTVEDVAHAADDLLPGPVDGSERLLLNAVEAVVEDEDKKQELIVRLGVMAMNRRLDHNPTREDLGFKPTEKLVGSVDEHSSNIWKVEDLIEMSAHHGEVSNTLTLARPEKDEFARLSPKEASDAREELDNINRTALNAIYDHYAVSYENAAAYESSIPGGKTLRVTIYPSVSAPVYFVEKIVIEDGNTPDIVDITTQAPDYSDNPEYIRVA